MSPHSMWHLAAIVAFLFGVARGMRERAVNLHTGAADLARHGAAPPQGKHDVAASVLIQEAGMVLSTISNATVKGNGYQCDIRGKKISVALAKKLGQGKNGLVYADSTDSYAVKVDFPNTNGDVEFEHECQVMQSLRDVPGSLVPRCYGTCKIPFGSGDFRSALLMELIPKKFGPISGASPATKAKIPGSIYTGVRAMLQHCFVTADQHAGNILVAATGAVYFIDMGEAFTMMECMFQMPENIPDRVRTLLIEHAFSLDQSEFARSSLDFIGLIPPAHQSGAADRLIEAFCSRPSSSIAWPRRVHFLAVTQHLSNDSRLEAVLTRSETVGLLAEDFGYFGDLVPEQSEPSKLVVQALCVHEATALPLGPPKACYLRRPVRAKCKEWLLEPDRILAALRGMVAGEGTLILSTQLGYDALFPVVKSVLRNFEVSDALARLQACSAGELDQFDSHGHCKAREPQKSSAGPATGSSLAACHSFIAVFCLSVPSVFHALSRGCP